MQYITMLFFLNNKKYFQNINITEVLLEVSLWVAVEIRSYI